MIARFLDFIFHQEFNKSLLIRLNLVLLLIILVLLPFTPINEGYNQEDLVFRRPLVQALPLTLPVPAVYPQINSQIPPPPLSAQGVFAVDLASQKILYQKGTDLRLYPASTTKLMTALVVLDKFKPQNVLTIYRDTNPISPVNFKKGESYTLQSLLKALLIPSSNEAALAIADNYPGGEDAFVAAMNQKAVTLNLPLTHFSNPSGLHDPSHFSSARALGRLATEALKNPVILKIVATKNTFITDLTGANNYSLENINLLLGIGGVDGVKTGFTNEAGGCLIATKGEDNHKILTVVLKSEDRFGDTQKLLDYLSGSYRW